MTEAQKNRKEVVKRAKELRAEGFNFSEVTQIMRDEGYKSQHGTAYSYSGLHSLMNKKPTKKVRPKKVKKPDHPMIRDLAFGEPVANIPEEKPSKNVSKTYVSTNTDRLEGPLWAIAATLVGWLVVYALFNLPGGN